jgi:hypothetical protein
MINSDLSHGTESKTVGLRAALSPSIRFMVPHLVAILFVSAIGFGMWGHSMRSEQASFRDAASYVEKAKNVWTNPFSGLLDAEPDCRPPGTVLMSFPFGFNENFGGFYFRSVYFPAVVAFLAVYVCAFRRSASFREHCNLAMVACTTVTMPMLYHWSSSTGMTSLFDSSRCNTGEPWVEKDGRYLAFGICCPSPTKNQFLLANSGETDRDNRRVLIPLPK